MFAGFRSLLAPVGALALLAATPVTLADGWRFAWRISVTEASDPRTKQYGQPSMAVQMVPGKIRMDFTGESGAGKQGKGYMLFDADAGTMALVNPDEKTAMMMDPSSLGVAAGAVGGVLKMDVTDMKFAVQDLGAGERILGRATHKYRITRAYTMSMSVFGKKMKSANESVIDAWMSNEMIADKSWEAWADRFSRGMGRLGGEAGRKLMESEKEYPRGVPLKQIIKSTDTDDKGKVTTSTSTMEMVELKKTSLDAALFEIPADYQVVDTKQAIAETEKAMEQAKKDCEKENGKGSAACDPSQINIDSLVVAARQGMMEGLKEGVKEAAKESAKDAVKRGIMGRLKKPGGE